MFQKIPILISILGIILGVFIAILFGINEDIFKDRIHRDLIASEHVLKLSEPQRASYIKKESSKNWRYYQRFHFHSTGISIMSLGLLILLGFSYAPKKIKALAAYLTAVGGFLYPFVWLFSGIYGPSLTRGIAKEKFAIFGYMGGVFLLGTIIIFTLIAKYKLVELKNYKS